jgi:15-cis-phytoene synthase
MSARLHTNAPVDPASAAAAGDVCRLHSHGLFLASFFLPPIKRNAVRAVFAFGWLIDQAIDESSCADDSIQGRLDLFRDRLDEIYDGRLELPAPEFRDQTQHILAAFAEAAVRFEIPRQYFIDWAEGFRMDRTVRRYATWSSLQKHCYHSGGVSALVMSCILGVQNSEGGKYAIALGSAIRFTRILANLKKDWARERIYLPLEDFARFGYTQRELAEEIVNPSFRELMKFEIARARELYRAGAEGICWLSDDGSRAAAAIIAVQSSSILRDIERVDYDVFRKPLPSGTARNLLHLPAAWRLARRAADQPMPRVF